MRKDMNSVVLKSGRPGQHRPFKGRLAKVEAGDEPAEIGRVRMKPRTGYWYDRNANCSFSPIRRWLAAQVGKLWAKSYSELSGKFLPSAQYSLREWTASEVSQNCYRNTEGALVFNWSYGGVREVSVNEYYVDPQTGILCRSRTETVRASNCAAARARKAERLEHQALTRVDGGEGLQYHKREGVWYEVQVASRKAAYALLESLGKRTVLFDTFQKGTVPARNHGSPYGNADFYAVSHRVLCRRDLRKLNLN